MKLSDLRFQIITKVERDPVHPHYIVLYGLFGRKLMQFIPANLGFGYGDCWAGDGNAFDDDLPRN